MSTFNVPSLFLPYVRGVNRSSVIDLNFVIDIVENLLQARGAISRIDHRPTKDGMGSMCFIHFNYWPRTRVATEMLIKLNAGERNVKIWHSDQYFWKVALNTAKVVKKDFAPFVEFDGSAHKPSEEELAAAAERNEIANKIQNTGQMMFPVVYHRLVEMNISEQKSKKTHDELYHLTGRIVGMFIDPESNNDLDECVRMCKYYMSQEEKNCTKNEMDGLIDQGLQAIE
jgi:hypothetical protein